MKERSGETNESIMLVNCTVTLFSGFITFCHSRKYKNGHLTLTASLYIFGAAGIKAIPELLIVLHLELSIGGSKLRGRDGQSGREVEAIC